MKRNVYPNPIVIGGDTREAIVIAKVIYTMLLAILIRTRIRVLGNRTVVVMLWTHKTGFRTVTESKIRIITVLGCRVHVVRIRITCKTIDPRILRR